MCILCVGLAQAVTQSLFSVVLQITMASACLGKCFLCSGFRGNTQLDLKRHLTKDHRVTLSHVIESESATLPPYSEADNITEGVPCFLCSSYSGNTWLKMVDHLKNVHAVPRSQVSDTYIGRQAKLEMNEKARTWYKKKQQCVPAVAITESAVTQQPSSADAGATKTNCDGTRWRLCWVQTDENFNPTAPYQLEGYCQASPAPSRVEVPATAPVSTFVEVMKEMLTSVQQPKQCLSSIVESKVTLGTAACAWKPGVDTEDKWRTKWPNTLPLVRHGLQFEPFEEYLNIIDLKSRSANMYTQGLEMLLSCVELEGGDNSLVGFVIGAYKQQILQKVFSLPIFKENKSFLGKVRQAMKHLVSHLQQAARAKDDVGALTVLDKVVSDVLHPLAPQVRKKRKACKHAKHDRDYLRQKNLPNVDVAKVVTKQAMMTLNFVCKAYRGSGELAPQARFMCNVLMAGILQFNGFCGRSMEWETLPRDHVRHQLEHGIEWLECKIHKTYETYGSVGKWLFPGTWAAVKVFLELPSRGSGLFFEPPRASADVQAMHSLLRKFCRVYTPGYQSWQTTLGRKYFASTNKNDDTGKTSRSIVANAQQHSERTAQENYECGNAETSARSGRAVALGVLREPVEWPTDEEIEKFEAATTLDEIVAAFARTSKKREPLAGKFARRVLQRHSSIPKSDTDIGVLDTKENKGKEEEHEKCKKDQKDKRNKKEKKDKKDKKNKKGKKDKRHVVEARPVHQGRQSPFDPQQQLWLQVKYREFGSTPPPSIIKGMWLREARGLSFFNVPEDTREAHALTESIRQYCRGLSKSERATASDCI